MGREPERGEGGLRGRSRRRLNAALRRRTELGREIGGPSQQGVEDAVARTAKALSEQANDPERARAALIDSASMSRNLWITFLSFGTYLVIAVGAVTHRQIFLEEPVRLPLLNVDLPLVAFFVVAPILFLIFHVYLLLHLTMMADDVRRYGALLRESAIEPTVENHIRQQLPNFVFLRLIGGPRRARWSLTDWLLIAIAWLTVAFGPVVLLVMTQLQFLPYHLEWATWVQRTIVLLDLALLWWFWPAILSGTEIGRTSRIAGRAGAALLSVCLFAFCIFIAAFPGELIYGNRVAKSFTLPVPPTEYFSDEFDRRSYDLTEYLFQGKVDEVNGKTTGLFSNRIVLPDQDFVDDEELARMIARQSGGEKPWQGERTRSLRGRDLRGAVLVRTDLRRADFTGASLEDANLTSASLEGALFGCAKTGRTDVFTASEVVLAEVAPIPEGCAKLQGASLRSAQLQGASLRSAQLQGASFYLAELQGALLERAALQGASLQNARLNGASLDEAELQGARLEGARLQGATFRGAQLQGASLSGARLQGAWLDHAQLQGASLDDAQLQGASLRNAQLQGASLDNAELLGASLDDAELQGASLDGTRLEGTSLTRTWLQGASLDHAHLRGAWLDHVQLQGVSLQDADLSNARIAKALLWRTDAAWGNPLVLDSDTRAVIGNRILRNADWDSEPVTDESTRERIDSWLADVPQGRLRPLAQERLDVLLLAARDAEADQLVADYWNALATESRDKAMQAQRETEHAQAFREEIAGYACNGGADAAAAIGGMLRSGIFTLRPGAAELAQRLLNCDIAAHLDEEASAGLKRLAANARPPAPGESGAEMPEAGSAE